MNAICMEIERFPPNSKKMEDGRQLTKTLCGDKMTMKTIGRRVILLGTPSK